MITRATLLASASSVVMLASPAWGQAATATQNGAANTSSTEINAQATVARERETKGAQGKNPVTTATGNLDARGVISPLPAEAPADPNDVVVTGYRASLGTAQAIKRNSDSIVDAIVAQDIGKLPDNTAAESLARITGVQVTRYSDEVNGVLVRGLPDVATTVNGRDIFTAENRRVALQDFPSGALQAIEVYKSGTADLLEPGLAGLINVRSFRPFDFAKKDLTFAGGLRGTYNDQSKLYDPLGNFLISYRKDTAIGEIGVLINGSYAQAQYRNAVRYGEGFVASPDDGTDITVVPASVGRAFKIPYRIGVYNDSGKRWRPAGHARVQWRPANILELYYDFVFQGYRGETAADWFGEYLLADKVALSDVVLKKGHPDQVETLSKSGGDPADMYRSTKFSRTDTYQAAAGARWVSAVRICRPISPIRAVAIRRTNGASTRG